MFKKATSQYHDPSQLKTKPFNFRHIEQYFLLAESKGALQSISERAHQDLDLDDVFKFIDRTTSSIGQQYLYYLLRTIPADQKRADRLEGLIAVFEKNDELKQTVLEGLSGLNNNDAYYVCSLFLQKYIATPKWFWIVPLLSVASVCSVVLSFIFPSFLFVVMLLLAVNFAFHYWNKNNLYKYASSIPQLSRMNTLAKKILTFDSFRNEKASLSASVGMLDRMSMSMSVFKLEAKLQSEIGMFVEYLVELIKALFLIEPILLFSTLKTLDARRAQVREVFDFIGEIDSALSIQALRESSVYSCIPSFSINGKQLNVVGVYHPLVFGAVANDIRCDHKSVLLTGSNMSGKSTFIRTIGINVLLAQTINTCFAEKFETYRTKIHSAIRVADDLLDDKSYYFEEVLIIKNLLDESASGAVHLFLLDELFKGTNTVERIAAGKSVLSYLNSGANLVFVSTHDLELGDFLNETFDLYHFSEVVEAREILFDYKLKQGTLITTNAIRILELNNYPPEVVADALLVARQLRKKK
ncbi:MutS-related protein [Dyadobacter sp. CY312]|uniref:MutS-related protein n=1 Tax=Dyadobacter sp. CY312 TaxID=2907303 RepID=UPI001F2B4122|nr:DNA mismatch repair protein MutS [Dyadobacter sp. CY312]MCE7040487.1 DNA mismatch repair protein MutS [Dyadobacter sp. CY312]